MHPVNDHSPKQMHPPALQPKHQELVRLLVWWRSRYPGIPLLLSKKDVDAALNRVWVAPQHYLPLRSRAAVGFEGMIMLIQLVLTFGWSASPGEWMVIAWVLNEYHAAFAPDVESSKWNHTVRFLLFFLMDDQVLVEPQLGMRHYESEKLAKKALVDALGEEACNKEKDEEEGSFEQEKWYGACVTRRNPCI